MRQLAISSNVVYEGKAFEGEGFGRDGVEAKDGGRVLGQRFTESVVNRETVQATYLVLISLANLRISSVRVAIWAFPVLLSTTTTVSYAKQI
jgi:hypothetical protein